MGSKPSISLIRATLVAGLVAGAFVGVLELGFALRGGPASGLALGGLTVLCLEVSLGLALGVLQTLVLLAVLRWDQLERLGAWAGRVAASPLRRAEPPPREASRVAGVLAALVAAGAIAIAWLALARAAMPFARAGVVAALTHGVAAAAVAALVVALAPALARVLTPLVARAPRVATVRHLALALAVLAVAAIVVARGPLQAFLRAVDVRPFALAGALLAADAVALLALAGNARVAAAARRATGWIGVAAIVAGLALGWIVALGPASDAPAALRVYRGRAPLARMLARTVAARLDGDGDGYSAFLGDGDCAPGDRARNPGAREIPGNGIDDDCFDGDRAVGDDPFAPPPPRPVPAEVPADVSFVMIVVDTLRYDHLSVYGYPRATSPNLARLAERAVVFERAYAPSAYTYASVPSIFTSQFPTMLPRSIMRKHGQIAEDDTTVAEMMAAAGYQTAIVSDDGGPLNEMGLVRGFAAKKMLRDQAEGVATQSIATIDAMGGKKFFLLSYFIGPHSPYLSHPGVPSFGTELVDRYDHEIATVDQAIGALLDRLDQPDLRGRVVVAVMSDHGEAFGEHGTYYHGHNLHEENVRVPLIIAAPGAPPRRLGAAPVSLIDVVPTLLNLARAEVDPALRGHDLTPALFAGEEDLARHVFLESHFTGYGVDLAYQAAVVTRTAKLIEDTGSRTYALYDLAADPGERDDLSDDREDQVLELRRALKVFQSHGR